MRGAGGLAADLKAVIEDRDEGDGAPVPAVIEEIADGEVYTKKDVRATLKHLNRVGEVYKPQDDRVRVTP